MSTEHHLSRGSRGSKPSSRARGGHGRGARRSGPSAAAARTPRAPIEPLHPTAEPPDIRSFHEFALHGDVLAAIDAMGISVPTPIQRLAIGPVLEGRDVIAKAETGTGKTLAFGAPILSKVDPARSTVLALALCPTRELAQQVCQVMTALGAPRGVRTALVVGGEAMHEQIAALKQGAQVVVGTPGRVLDLYGQGFLSFPWTEFVVLDEADEMLEIGFLDDVKKILSFTPDERQTLHFSATFPPEVLQLARESTRNPVEVATAKGVATVDTIEQSFIRVPEEDRPFALRRLIEASEPDDVFLVFCDRRTEVDRLMRVMERMPFSTKALHGGFDQPSRFRVMSAYRTGEVKALVATDVASRGLDVAHVTYVVNFAVPQDISDYTHRIGRTGRAGRRGRAITLVTPRAERDWQSIQRDAPWNIPEAELPQRGRGGPERAPRPDRPRRAGRPDGPEPAERADRPERFERASRSERAEGAQPGGRGASNDRAERSPRPRQPAAARDERGPRERPTSGGGGGESQQVAGRARRSESTRERLARERAGAPGGTPAARERGAEPPPDERGEPVRGAERTDADERRPRSRGARRDGPREARRSNARGRDAVSYDRAPGDRAPGDRPLGDRPEASRHAPERAPSSDVRHQRAHDNDRGDFGAGL